MCGHILCSRHLGWFHIFAIMNGTVFMGVQISLQQTDFISLGFITTRKITGHMVALFLSFWGTTTLFFIMAVLVLGTFLIWMHFNIVLIVLKANGNFAFVLFYSLFFKLWGGMFSSWQHGEFEDNLCFLGFFVLFCKLGAHAGSPE